MTSARIAVRVHARARRDELSVGPEGVVIARVAAPAVEGRANRALCRLVAERLGIAPSRVRIVRGERSRDKLVEAEGIDQATALGALRS